MVSDGLKISKGLGLAIKKKQLASHSLSLERDVSALPKHSNRDFILILLSSIITLPGTDTHNFKQSGPHPYLENSLSFLVLLLGARLCHAAH